MKKFSKVKYFGAVAAALLAVAPIAAPVVSQVASPATVQAAAATGSEAWAVKALDNAFSDSATVGTTVAQATTFYSGVDTPVSPSETSTANTVLNAFLRSGNTAADLANANLSVTFNDYAGYSAAGLAQQVPQAGKTSFQVTIKAVSASDASKTLASKVVTLNVGSKSSAAVTGATGTVTGSTASAVTPASMASATKITDRDGNAISLSGADFTFAGWTNDPSTTATLAPTSSATYGDTTTRIANDDGSAFANPGASYAVFKIAGAATSDKFKQVNFDDLKNTYANAWVSNGDWYFARPVNVSTGSDDLQYYPVFKYTYSTGTPVTPGQTVNYTNGQTVGLNTTDANTLTFYIGSTTQASDTQNIADKINSIIGDGKSLTAINSTNDSSPLAPVAVTKTDVDSVITNPYKAGTYSIPVTAKNPKNGFVTKVYVPVAVNTTVGSPVAVSFTGYTEITKGDKFDPMAGIRFQNSPTDSSVIGASGIQVSGNVDTTTPGTYTVTYTVTNTSGRTATFTRTVVVKDGALTESNADGVVYINKADGAVVYSDAATTKGSSTTLDNTTAWKFHSVVKDSAGKIVAYNLGGKQYVKASEVSTSPVKAQAGVFTVHYPANSKWSIAVYNSNLKVVKLIPAKSSWLTFGTKTLKDGKSYYNLGGNQWVRTDYGFWNAK